MQANSANTESNPSDEPIIYEQPLTERVRIFLRIQFLFAHAEQYAQPANDWDSRMAVNALLNLADILSHSKVRSEVVQGLDTQIGLLTPLRDQPGVNNSRLLDILDKLEVLKKQISSDINGPFGQKLRSNKFLSAIKNRSAIPGGTCEFDLPSYHFWLSKSNADRATDTAGWLQELEPLREAIAMLLDLNRKSADAVDMIAERGMFQHRMQDHSNCQLIRVSLPSDTNVFPEISGGKHRFTIRFLSRSDIDSRPRQVEHNVDFQLTLCHL